MNRYIYIYFMLIIAIKPLFGQKFILSSPLPLANYETYDALGFFDDHFVSIRTRDNILNIQAYDRLLQSTWAKKIKLSYKNVSFIESARYGDAFYAFYRCKHKRHNEIRFHKYDGVAVLQDSSALISLTKFNYIPPFQSAFSKDNSKLLLYTIKQGGSVHLISFDLKMGQKIFDKEVKINDFRTGIDDLNFIIKNNGDGLIFHNKNNTSYKKKSHILYQYTLTKEHQIINTFNYNGLTFSQQKYVYDEINNQVLHISIVPQKRRLPQRILVRYLKDSIKSSQYIKLGNLGMLKSDKEKKERKIMDDIYIEDIVLRKDGGFVLFLEKRYVFQSTNARQSPYQLENSLRQSTQYYNEDVLVFNLNPDGTVLWKNRISKKQSSFNDFAIYSSGYIIPTSKSINYYYNDQIKKDTKIFNYVIQANGDIKRHFAYNTLNKKLQLRWKDAIHLSKNQIIVPSQYRKELRFLLIEN